MFAAAQPTTMTIRTGSSASSATLIAPPLSRRQPVERALQDEGGGRRVDLFRALLARQVGFEHGALGGGGGKPLVPEHDREVGQRREVAEEGARRLRARPLGAVHVDRQAEDQPADLLLRAERQQRLRVLAELRAADRVERRGDPEPGSDSATPIVLVPRSSPARRAPGGSAAASASIGISGPAAIARF